MNLPKSIIKEFAKQNVEKQNDQTIKNVQLVGTVYIEGNQTFVYLDGSDGNATPVSETVKYQNGDRVLVSIQNRKATIIGNYTDPAISKALVSVVVEYALSSSKTSFVAWPGEAGQWNTKAPDRVDGSYMWQRTTSVSSDTSEPLNITMTCIQGADGEGERGVSLTSITRYYKLSDNVPTDYPPLGSGWQSTEPTYTPGDSRNLYICDLFSWSDETITHSEISLSSSYEAAKQAFNAAQGAMTAANGKNKVYHQTSQPTGGVYKTGDIWFDTDGGNKIYIYNETNGTWEASLIGNDAIVASGIDAGKITVGTLDANRIAANSLTIGKITTSDQEKILNSNVQVGGRNLLPDTNVSSLTKASGKANRYFSDSGNSDVCVPTFIDLTDTSRLGYVSPPVEGLKYGIKFPITASKSGGRGLCWYSGAAIKIIPGQTYTFSCYAKIVSGEIQNIRLQLGYTSYISYVIDKTNVVSNKWTKISVTFTAPTTSTLYNNTGVETRVYGPWVELGKVGVLEICGMKLELGNKATDWTPAQEDVDGDINDLMSFRDSVANEGYTSINGSKIRSGTITLGGTVNGDGSLEVYDSSNNLVSKLSKNENIFAGFKIKAKYGRLLLEDSGGLYTNEQSYWWLKSTDYEYEYDYFFEPIPTAQIAQYTYENEFLYDSFDGWHQSNNKGFGSTAALDVIELNLAERTHLYMDVVDYNNETSNDYGTVGTIDGTALDTTSTYSATNSQVKWTGYNNHKQGGETIDFGFVSAGRHRIWIRYKKNASVNNENDRLYFTLYTDKEDALVYEDDNKYTLMYISKTRIYQRKIIRNSENNMISYDVYKTLSRNGNIKSEHAQSDYVSSGTKEIPLNSYESETNINGAALEFSNEGRNSTISFYGPAEPNGMYLFESGLNVFGEIDNSGFPIWNLQNSLVLTNHDFATTVASGAQESWNKVITKSGYYPLGVAGFGTWNDTGSGSSYARIWGCRLSARSLGSTTLTYAVRADGGKVNNCKFRASILWAKAHGDPG